MPLSPVAVTYVYSVLRTVTNLTTLLKTCLKYCISRIIPGLSKKWLYKKNLKFSDVDSYSMGYLTDCTAWHAT